MTQGIADGRFNSAISRQIGTHNSAQEAAAIRFGDQLDSIEHAMDLAFAAGSIDDLKGDAAALKLLDELGLGVEWKEKTVTDGNGNTSRTMQATKSLEGIRQALQMRWQRVSTAFQGFVQMARARFDLLREGIRNLSVR